jgi:flagellar hook-basal body complex protein FliE
MNPLAALSYLSSSPLSGSGSASKTANELLAKPIPSQELSPLTTQNQTLGPLPQSGNSFSTMLGQMVQEVGTKQAAAGEAVSGLLGGQNVPLHQAMIAMEEASVSFQLMVEVRNKLLESYQELMRMQI